MFRPNKAKAVKITLHRMETNNHLPRLHWEWTEEDGSVHHRWICNFRRYGWCYTSEPTGEQGYRGVTYANGDFGMLNIVDSPEMGITLALEATLQEMCREVDGGEIRAEEIVAHGLEKAKQMAHDRKHRFLPQGFVDLARPALEWLLKDAIANKTVHASRKPDSHVLPAGVEVTVAGFQPLVCGRDAEQVTVLPHVKPGEVIPGTNIKVDMLPEHYPAPEDVGVQLDAACQCEEGSNGYKVLVDLLRKKLDCDRNTVLEYLKLHMEQRGLAWAEPVEA